MTYHPTEIMQLPIIDSGTLPWYLFYLIITYKYFSEISCENGTAYRPCVEPPYQKSCPTKEPVQITTKELAEGCFLLCKDGEVVIDGKCVSEESCNKCYDKNSTTFKQVGWLKFDYTNLWCRILHIVYTYIFSQENSGFLQSNHVTYAAA